MSRASSLSSQTKLCLSVEETIVKELRKTVLRIKTRVLKSTKRSMGPYRLAKAQDEALRLAAPSETKCNSNKVITARII